MDKPTTGIPTVYKGIQFRSRLESRWAAFFDLLEWPWQYEPFDLEGWIPDFLLTGSSKVLVEVKPVVEFPEQVAAELSRTSWEGDILIVGCALDPASGLYGNDTFLGWYREARADNPGGDWSKGRSYWSEAAFYGDPARIGFSDVHGGWGDRIFPRDYERSKYGWGNGISPEVLELWNRAGNLTQWRGKQSVVQS